jgi:protein-L-isoaspartate(D-aspartate) O-methyltransferase
MLAKQAEQTLQSLGYDNISVKRGDGSEDWRDEAPFDTIIVTAAAAKILPSFMEQLGEDGRLVIPVGRQFLTQHLMLLEKHNGDIVQKDMMLVRFVPLNHQ